MTTLALPPRNEDLSLRYYTEEEKELIDLRHRGVGDTHSEEEFGPDRSGAMRHYSCAWGHRYAAVLMILGFQSTYTVCGEKRISRLKPFQHELAQFNWVATACRIRGFSFTGGTDDFDTETRSPRFKRADLDVNYELATVGGAFAFTGRGLAPSGGSVMLRQRRDSDD